MKRSGRKTRGSPKRKKRNLKTDERWTLPYNVETRGRIHNTVRKYGMKSIEQSENMFIEAVITAECKSKQQKEIKEEK